MSVRIRSLLDKDRDALLALHLSRCFRYSKIREVDEMDVRAFQQRRFSHLLSLSTERDYLQTFCAEIAGTPIGYIIMYTGSCHEIAGSPQAQVVSWYSTDSPEDAERAIEKGFQTSYAEGESSLKEESETPPADPFRDKVLSALLHEAEKHAVTAGCHHITVSIPAGDAILKLALAADGFSGECFDFIIKYKKIDCSPHPRFNVERGREKDLDSILELALLNADSLIPPLRRVTIHKARHHILELMKSLPGWLKGDQDFAVLVARKKGSSSILGFSLLYLKNHCCDASPPEPAHVITSEETFTAAAVPDVEPEAELFERSTVDDMTGMSQGYFLLISVVREEWGKAVARHLTSASASVFKESGFDYFSGEMLCGNHNPRARLQRMYGPLFEIEKVQMVKSLILTGL